VRNQFGASSAGLWARDHSSFLASYEGFLEVRAATPLRTVPGRAGALYRCLPANIRAPDASASPSVGVSVRLIRAYNRLPSPAFPFAWADQWGCQRPVTADRVPAYEHHGMVSSLLQLLQARIRCSCVTLAMTLFLCAVRRYASRNLFQGSRWAMRSESVDSLCRSYSLERSFQ